jgi:hypothetical protein
MNGTFDAPRYLSFRTAPLPGKRVYPLSLWPRQTDEFTGIAPPL